MKDFLYLSSKWCRGRSGSATTDHSLFSRLLSTTASEVWVSQSTAFPRISSSLSVSSALMLLLLQQTTAKYTDWKKNSSFLLPEQEIEPADPFLCIASVFGLLVQPVVGVNVRICHSSPHPSLQNPGCVVVVLPSEADHHLLGILHILKYMIPPRALHKITH